MTDAVQEIIWTASVHLLCPHVSTCTCGRVYTYTKDNAPRNSCSDGVIEGIERQSTKVWLMLKQESDTLTVVITIDLSGVAKQYWSDALSELTRS